MKKKQTKKKHDCTAEMNEVIQYLARLVHSDHSENLECAVRSDEKEWWDNQLKINNDALSFLNYLTTLGKK